MNQNFSICIKLLTVLCLSISCFAQDFDFFYFVQQWPGSYCDTKRSCCYPTTGKPAENFSIHGLWPNYNNGSYPQNCNRHTPFDQTLILDLMSKMRTEWPTLACPSSGGLKFWAHEWGKHGTCSQKFLDEHDYFKAALDLKDKANLLQILKDAGIEPDGNKYSSSSIKGAIEDGIGFTPGIECNVDEHHDSQFYQVYLCVDTSGSEFIKCPVLPRSSSCYDDNIEFPPFDSSESNYGVAGF